MCHRGREAPAFRPGRFTLAEIKPAYEDEDYKNYFEDIYAKTEGAGNAEMKAELIKGLAALKPEKRNKDNSAFWEKLEKLTLAE